MSEREGRIARNEAVAREINEGIEDARPANPEDYLRMVCECGRPHCSSVSAISIRAYEAVREDSRMLVVGHAHFSHECDCTVATIEQFVFLCKREGSRVAIAE